MYKCYKCQLSSWAVAIDKEGKAECFDCLLNEEPDMEEPEIIPPPLGWMGKFHESETLYDYSMIGTRKWKGPKN